MACKSKIALRLAAIALLLSCVGHAQQSPAVLKIAPNKRYFQTADQQPFFWLGDTGWLLFVKLTREEVLQYLDRRKEQGFNLIQVMVIHDIGRAMNRYGDSAFHQKNVAHPFVTPGNDFNKPEEYDFWDHIDFVVNAAAERGIYMGLVPVWGSNVKNGHVLSKDAAVYAKFLAERYKGNSNIVWLNGGDIKGSDSLNVWNVIGKTLKQYDTKHLVTFHPRGRTSSSEWFHNAAWLDFNMFQSGHRNYAQDTSASERWHYGEDNWRYARADYAMKPAKPTMDGEPSYENIPQGLHDSLQPRWLPADIRRYAYWNTFAGAAGFTYGENSIMQFHNKGDRDANYGVMANWTKTIDAPGAWQMQWLKKLMLSVAFTTSVPAKELIADNGERYNYVTALAGKDFLFAYTYTGRKFTLDLSKLKFTPKNASWYNPSTGNYDEGTFTINKKAKLEFDPPGDQKPGNDWVLVIR